METALTAFEVSVCVILTDSMPNHKASLQSRIPTMTTALSLECTSASRSLREAAKLECGGLTGIRMR